MAYKSGDVPNPALDAEKLETQAHALFDAGQRRARQRARDVQDLRDKPRCDVHGTALERVTVTMPTTEAKVTSWRCMFCDLEATEELDRQNGGVITEANAPKFSEGDGGR